MNAFCEEAGHAAATTEQARGGGRGRGRLGLGRGRFLRGTWCLPRVEIEQLSEN